jgi:transposase InsO family protein
LPAASGWRKAENVRIASGYRTRHVAVTASAASLPNPQPSARHNGRTFRTLNIVDDASCECLAIEVDHGLSGIRVTRVLDRVAASRPLPRRIV